METLLSDRTLFSSELLNENKDVGSILILGLGKNKNPKTEREVLPRVSRNPVFWRIPTGAFDGIICELNERYSEQQPMAVSPISGAHESRHQRDTASGHSLKFSITAILRHAPRPSRTNARLSTWFRLSRLSYLFLGQWHQGCLHLVY